MAEGRITNLPAGILWDQLKLILCLNDELLRLTTSNFVFNFVYLQDDGAKVVRPMSTNLSDARWRSHFLVVLNYL